MHAPFHVPAGSRRITLSGFAALLALCCAPPALAVGDGGDVNPAVARMALVDLLQEQGLTPPADSPLGLADYIDLVVFPDSDGERRVKLIVSMDADGHPIPNRQWRDAHRDYCKMRAREPATVQRQLQLEIFKWHETADTGAIRGLEDADGRLVRNQYIVHGRVVDKNSDADNVGQAADSEASTGHIRQGKRGIGNSPDAAPLANTFRDLIDQINPGFAQPGDACGTIRVTHLQGNREGEPAVFLAGYKGYTGSTLTYAWTFGDGKGTDGTKQPSHVYDKAGSYRVTVTIGGQVDGRPVSGQRSLDVRIGAGDTPLDGLWRADIVRSKRQCNPLARQILDALSKGTGTSMDFSGRSGQAHITFPRPFTPDPLVSLMSRGSGKADRTYQWKNANGIWTTEADMMGGMIRMAYRFEPHRKTITGKVHQTMDKRIGCTTDMDIEYTWLGAGKTDADSTTKP